MYFRNCIQLCPESGPTGPTGPAGPTGPTGPVTPLPTVYALHAYQLNIISTSGEEHNVQFAHTYAPFGGFSGIGPFIVSYAGLYSITYSATISTTTSSTTAFLSLRAGQILIQGHSGGDIPAHNTVVLSNTILCSLDENAIISFQANYDFTDLINVPTIGMTVIRLSDL
jgi:hypothetical protein